MDYFISAGISWLGLLIYAGMLALFFFILFRIIKKAVEEGTYNAMQRMESEKNYAALKNVAKETEHTSQPIPNKVLENMNSWQCGKCNTLNKMEMESCGKCRNPK